VDDAEVQEYHSDDSNGSAHGDGPTGGADGGVSAATQAELQSYEAEVDADQTDKEAFERRLAEKDEARTRRVATGEGRGEKQDAMFNRELSQLGADGRQGVMDDVRVTSRREYLKMREARELTLLRDSIQYDDDLLARGERFSTAEIERYERNKELLRLVQERVEAPDEEDAYVMPGDMMAAAAAAKKGSKGGVASKPGSMSEAREALLNSRYRDPTRPGFAGAAKPGGAAAGGPSSEQAEWEAQQSIAASGVTGHRDAVTRRGKAVDVNAGYELVMEDQLSFVSEVLLQQVQAAKTARSKSRRDAKLARREGGG
jgi:hypothetical protein